MKFLLGIVFLFPLLCCAETTGVGKTLDELMSRWLSLESQKGAMQSEWNTRKVDLEQRLSLFNIEQEALQQVLAKTTQTNSDVDQRRISLLKAQGELEQEQALVSDQTKEVMALAQSLESRLPPPLQKQWEEKWPLLSQTDISNSDKLERLLGLFKLIEDFNHRIALNRSVMTLPGPKGQSQRLLVTQIYLGASQGWYVNDDGSAYGYGRATKLGWNWWHGDKASEELGHELDPQTLLRVRAILENPTTASFVSLPIKL